MTKTKVLIEEIHQCLASAQEQLDKAAELAAESDLNAEHIMQILRLHDAVEATKVQYESDF